MNIIHIHSHDTGKLISPYGFNLPTPNLEKLAEEMITFENYFTVSPTCTPSRSASMTGLYPSNNGLIGLAHRGFELLRKDLHLANVLQSNGYNTILSGIQHEIGKYDVIDPRLTQELGYTKNITSKEKCGDKSWDYENLNNTLEFIENYSSDKPFFLSHGTFSTHRPYYINEKIKSTYYTPYKSSERSIIEDNNNFHHSVEVYDEIIGKIIESVKVKGLYEETIIIISTDHGIANPEYKCNLNDEGTNIMLMMRVPGYELLNNSKCHSLLSNIDLAPTLYDILGIDIDEKLDGSSFKQILTKEKEEINEELFFEINYHTSYEPAISVRTKDYRLTKKLDESYNKINWSNIDNSALKDLYYRLFKDSEKNMEVFTDYRHNTSELLNDNSEVVTKLNKSLVRWNAERQKLSIDKDKLRINEKTDYNPTITKN